VALLIQNPEAERLLREKAAETGQSVDEVVIKALHQTRATELQERFAKAAKWEKIIFPVNDERVSEAIREFREAVAGLPILDDRSADEILGYDEWGLPH
jgi:antitoxin VapB